MSTSTVAPTQICESILREEIRYNVEHSILPSEVAVAERLLGRTIELVDAYAELHDALDLHPRALRSFIGLLLSTAAFWNPARNAQARAEREKLVETNRKIADLASSLADLLEQREELHNHSGFSADTFYDICDVIEIAAEDNGLFSSYLKKPLSALRQQYDLKYWPSLGEVLQVIANDAYVAVPAATDPLTAAATSAKRSSLADFLKALFASIAENSAPYGGGIPKDFRPSDNTIASLVNCALGLSPEEMVGATYVKRFRQRGRESSTQQANSLLGL